MGQLFGRLKNFSHRYDSKRGFPDLFSEGHFLVLSMFVLAVFLLVVYWRGGNTYVLIHDNLDANVVWFKLLSRHKCDYFRLFATIPDIMNGVPIFAISPGVNIGEMLHVFLGTMPAIIINETVSRMVAFWGMYLLLRQHLLKEQPLVSVGVALCFALLPFWPSGFLSVSGQPMLLYAFLNIRKGRDGYLDWLIIVIYPLYSSLVLAGFAVVLLLALLPVVDALRDRPLARKYLAGLGVLCFLYLVANYRLIYATFVNEAFVSHRTAFLAKGYGLGETLKAILKNFFSGQYHAASLQGRNILVSVAVAIVFLVMRRKTDKRTPFFLLLLACLALSVFYGMWKYLEPSLPNHLLLTGFQWERLHFLHPLFWYLLFALSLCIILETTKKYHKAAVAFVFLLISFQAAYAIQNSDALREKAGSGISFSGFFAEPLFADISAYIGQPKSTYRVASLGIHPSIAQYNGFYTLDGYLANYPLDYKNHFRKIIAEELSKSPVLKKYFDEWGSRCYLFSSEIGHSYFNQKTSSSEMRNLQIDTEQFRRMGGRYIFSAVPMLNFNENGLVLKKVFEKDDLPWRIWLYEAVCPGHLAG